MGGTTRIGSKESVDLSLNALLMKHMVGPHAEITAPGATIAMGLVNMRSNYESIANKLELPTSDYHLNSCGPHLILLRVISKNLIMWDRIEPTREWIMSQIPTYLKDLIATGKGRTEKSDAVLECDLDSEAESVADAEAVWGATWAIVAGACFSIALKYAGSADSTALRTLMHHFDYFLAGAEKGEFIVTLCIVRSLTCDHVKRDFRHIVATGWAKWKKL